MIFTHHDITRNLQESCDVCVVGSGAGGAVVALELAEAGLSVILLEEGGYYDPKNFRTIDTLRSITNLYRDAGCTMILGKPNVLFSEGRCVGGSTTINGGMCWRTPDKILRRWQWENGLQDVTPESMARFFERVEAMISVNPVLPESMNNDALLLKKGAEVLGYRVRANRRAHQSCVGANQCVMGCPTGAKQPTLVTYIPAFLKSGGRLYANCRVRKVRIKNGHAAGVDAVIVDPGTKKVTRKITIHSPVTVVCGGALQTPSLLMRSHVPDASGLLGKNLFTHPNAKVVGVFEDKVEAWKGVNQAYQVTEFMDEGILMGVNFLPPGLLTLAIPFSGKNFLPRMKAVLDHCIVGAALIEDTSRGRVLPLPLDQTIALYALNRRDFDQARRATALMSEVYFAAGARSVYLPFTGLHEIHSMDEIRKIYEYPIRPADLELMTVHVMGTCQMGTDPKRSVINPFGECHQVRGLFVADASIFPTSIGVNPQETIMAFATRTAFHIAENRMAYTT